MEPFGISLAKYIKNSEVTASDISMNALNIAKQNAENLIKDKKMHFIESDMFKGIEKKFDAIVSNPPYVKREAISSYSLKYEPKLALDGGIDGLDFYRIIINEGYNYLKENRNFGSGNRI
ncbi:MAG: methyltransferase [Clostridia bacterium]|nr:methyltransferase [Clostridia bacterium]